MKVREPLVGIVILNWNRPVDTIACLKSLEQVTYRNFLTIVIDNGSTDGSPEKIRAAIPALELIQSSKNLGFSAGVNIGINRALELGAEYVLILNNDTVAAPQTLGLLVETCERDVTVGIGVPKIYYYDHPTRIYAAGAQWHTFPPRVTMIGFGQEDDSQCDKPRDLDYATGCAMLVRRQVFETVGDFDPSYFMYQEDYDFCYRARRAGFHIVYVPQAKVWHKASLGLGENSPSKWCLWSKGVVIFYRKNLSLFALVCFLGWVAMREMLKGNLTFLRPFLRGVSEGLKIKTVK